MKLSDSMHFVFRPLDRWGLGLWMPCDMAEQVCGEAEARGDTSGPTRRTVLQRLRQLVKWEWRFGPWAIVALPHPSTERTRDDDET